MIKDVSCWELFEKIIAKSKSKVNCVVCGERINMGEPRIKYLNFYVPTHHQCFTILMAYLFPEIREITDKEIIEFRKKLIARAI